MEDYSAIKKKIYKYTHNNMHESPRNAKKKGNPQIPKGYTLHDSSTFITVLK